MLHGSPASDVSSTSWHRRFCGRDSIKHLAADRECVCNEWFGWLNENAILHYIRIRDNFWVEDPRRGRKIRAQYVSPISNTGKNASCIVYTVSVVNSAICPETLSKTRPESLSRRTSFLSADRKKHSLPKRKDGLPRPCSKAWNPASSISRTRMWLI